MGMTSHILQDAGISHNGEVGNDMNSSVQGIIKLLG